MKHQGGYRHVEAPHGGAKEDMPAGVDPLPPIKSADSPEHEPTQPATPTTSDPTSMTYDEYRLWKHKQKRAKKHAQMMAKYGRDIQPEEPEFGTYSEYQAWKSQQKQDKSAAKKEQKWEKKTGQWGQHSEPAIPPMGGDETMFQHPRSKYAHDEHHETF